MTIENKSRTTTALIIFALVQGPILYYFTFGFFKLAGTVFFGVTGFILTLILFIYLIRNRSTTTKYHTIGITLSFIIGLLTIRGDAIEYLDWNLRKGERNKIVENVKNGLLKSQNIPYIFFPISQGGEINIEDNSNGIVSIDFYIDKGFLDHYSAFVYTNNPDEIKTFDSGIGPFGGGTVKKLDANWYRVSY
jgi:hypothetical protein